MTADTSRRSSPLASRRRALIALALVATVAAFPTGRPHAASPRLDLRVDPNTAPAAVLEALPRVGPVMAATIIEARERRPFTDLDDFDRRVRGIGPVTREALRPYLRFEVAASSPSKDR